jgi:adenylate cyclase
MARHRSVLRYALIGAAIGVAYGYAVTADSGVHALHGGVVGAVTGGLIGAAISGIEALLGQVRLGETLHRAPFALHVAAKAALYLAIIGVALAVGRYVVLGRPPSTIAAADVLFSVAGAFVIAFLVDINRLLGQNVLLNFLTGRYYRPRLEERIFLFIDMKAATTFGERLGPLEFHRLLNRFVSDLAEPIVARNGEIYRYVGDEVIATWIEPDGVEDARCVRAYFDAVDRLARLAPEYERQFGQPVSFRGALHSGPVVAGEIGSIKKEIAFLGDTINTTARIEEFCRRTDHTLLISARLLERLALPPEFRRQPLGTMLLRGKTEEIELYALTRTL